MDRESARNTTKDMGKKEVKRFTIEQKIEKRKIELKKLCTIII